MSPKWNRINHSHSGIMNEERGWIWDELVSHSPDNSSYCHPLSLSPFTLSTTWSWSLKKKCCIKRNRNKHEHSTKCESDDVRERGAKVKDKGVKSKEARTREEGDWADPSQRVGKLIIGSTFMYLFHLHRRRKRDYLPLSLIESRIFGRRCCCCCVKPDVFPDRGMGWALLLWLSLTLLSSIAWCDWLIFPWSLSTHPPVYLHYDYDHHDEAAC